MNVNFGIEHIGALAGAECVYGTNKTTTEKTIGT